MYWYQNWNRNRVINRWKLRCLSSRPEVSRGLLGNIDQLIAEAKLMENVYIGACSGLEFGHNIIVMTIIYDVIWHRHTMAHYNSASYHMITTYGNTWQWHMISYSNSLWQNMMMACAKVQQVRVRPIIFTSCIYSPLANHHWESEGIHH